MRCTSRQARGGGAKAKEANEGPRHLGTWGAPKWPPIPPDARRAPGNPWRASIFVAASIFVVIRSRGRRLRAHAVTVRGWIDGAAAYRRPHRRRHLDDAGIPDFRGPQGVWTKNLRPQKMATIQHYVADPEVRKRAWRSRLEMPIHDREPNNGTARSSPLERRGILDTLITRT